MYLGIQLVVVTLVAATPIRTREMRRSRAMRPPKPNQAALLLDTMPIQPRSQPHQCVRRITAHLATWSACTAPGPPQESLERDETWISLPAKPSLTRTTLCQLCIAPWAPRSRLAATEPGLEPRISGGTAWWLCQFGSTLMCFRTADSDYYISNVGESAIMLHYCSDLYNRLEMDCAIPTASTMDQSTQCESDRCFFATARLNTSRATNSLTIDQSTKWGQPHKCTILCWLTAVTQNIFFHKVPWWWYNCPLLIITY
jgi:hypothetical protein